MGIFMKRIFKQVANIQVLRVNGLGSGGLKLYLSQMMLILGRFSPQIARKPVYLRVSFIIHCT